MYSSDDTNFSTALLGVFIIGLLIVASLATGSVAASTGSTATTPALSDANTQNPQQLDDVTQEWCVKFVSPGVNADLPTDIACDALNEISPHQQIGVDYSIQNYADRQYIILTVQSNATQPAEANLTIEKGGEIIASHHMANTSLAFVHERHYNLLTEEYNTTEEAEESGVTGPTIDSIENEYTEEQVNTILKTNLTGDELRNLRMHELQLEDSGTVKRVVTEYNYTEADFNGQTEEFDYTISIDISSRDQQVASTEFTVSRIVQRSVLDETIPGEDDGTSDGGTEATDRTSSTQVTQVIQSGFDVTLNETITSDVSRYADGTSQITALQDPRVPPNAGGSNAAVGQANNMSNLRENSTQYPAVLFGDNSEDMLHIGTSYYGVPQADNHYLILTYGLQGEANTEAEVRIVDRQGEVIDPNGASQNPRPFILEDTMNDTLDLNDREQFRQAIEQSTTETKQVVIRLTDEEVEYINDNYEAFVTYRTDGGEDALLLYEAQIASTDIVRESTKLEEDAGNESQYEEQPATFNVSYRMPYSMNAEYQQIDILPGETFKLPVTIENHGDTRVERTIGLHDEYAENNMNYSTVVSERTVMVPPQSKKTVFVEYTWDDYQHGNHTVTLYDTTDDENWESVNSQGGAAQYEVYVYQPPTFEIVGMNAPDSWLRYDHFQTLVAVQNVGDLDTSFLPEDEQPYIQGKFGPWQGSISGYVSGGNVRAGEGGGTVNMYFQRSIDYTPNYPNPNQAYDNNTWRQNAPYHTELSAAENENGEDKGPFPLTVEAVHPWAVIDGTNDITNTQHTEYITYQQLEAPQENADNETVYERITPETAPFVDYTQNTEREQRDMFIYQNELRNCHLAGNHTEYRENISSEWNENETVDNCRGMMQKDVKIYELGISTLRMRNANDEMVERRWNDNWEKITPNKGVYYASPWPYTETDPSTYNHDNTYQNIENVELKNHYQDIPEWSVNGYATDTRLDQSEINSILAQYENGELSYTQLNKRLLSDQEFQNWQNGDGQPAFTDRQLERVTSCDGSTTSQLENTSTPPDCPGFGLQTQQMPTTVVENIHPPVETEAGHKFYVDVHILNRGAASAGYARVKIVTNKTGTGLNNTTTIGHGVAKIPPNSDKIFRVPVILPNEPGVDAGEGNHDIQVRVRTEPDYTSYRVYDNWEYDQGAGRFGIDFTVQAWEDFVFENMSTTADTYKTINQICSGSGVGECQNQGEQTTFTSFNYTNYGGEVGNHSIHATYGFWKTPTGGGSDWPTLHHQQNTRYWDDRVYAFEDDQWLSSTPGDGSFVPAGSGLQKDDEQRYGVNETERWVLQNQIEEPGIYRVYVTQERLNNEDVNGNNTLEQYENETWSMWGSGANYNGAGNRDSVSRYQNESHYVTFEVFDIKDPVSRFNYEAENFPTTHSASAYDNTTNGNVVIWEGGTAHFDGRERLDWTAQQFENGIAYDKSQGYNVSSDNVGIDVYDWTFEGGDARIYQQAHDNRGGTETEGKVSRRFNDSGSFDVTLQVWDYPQYTEGADDANANTNTSTQTVEVKADNEAPTVDITNEGNNQNYDVNHNVVWSGVPADRSAEFTTVDFSVYVADNAIGVECGGQLDDGSTVDHCAWTKDDGTWNNVYNGSPANDTTWTSEIHYLTEQDSQECVQFYAQDFNALESDDESCVNVYQDTAPPDADYKRTSDSWVWGSYSGTGYQGGLVQYSAADSTDTASGPYEVGLHAQSYDHTLSGGWEGDATKSTRYDTGAEGYREETESVKVRDWYGNQDTAEASVIVRTDGEEPDMNSNSETFGEYQYSGSSENPSRSEQVTVCATNVHDEGYNGGVGLYDSDACHTFTANFDFSGDLSPPAPSRSDASFTDPNPACEEYETDYDTVTTSDSYTDHDSDSGSAQVTIEDYHGNTKTVTVSFDATAEYEGSETRSEQFSKTYYGGDCPEPTPTPDPCVQYPSLCSISAPDTLNPNPQLEVGISE